jgi:hypothetical protein
MTRVAHIISISYRKEYTYRVNFEGGATGEVDFADYLELGPVFAPLKDVSYFRQARLEGGTITWPNGADVAPETLEERVEFITEAAAQKSQARPDRKKSRRR